MVFGAHGIYIYIYIIYLYIHRCLSTPLSCFSAETLSGHCQRKSVETEGRRSESFCKKIGLEDGFPFPGVSQVPCWHVNLLGCIANDLHCCEGRCLATPKKGGE